jgi:hypothetical protein
MCFGWFNQENYKLIMQKPSKANSQDSKIELGTILVLKMISGSNSIKMLPLNCICHYDILGNASHLSNFMILKIIFYNYLE